MESTGVLNSSGYRAVVGCFALVCTFALAAGSTMAQTRELRLAQQYGVASLPLMIMQHQKLVEKHAAKAGLGTVKVSWVTFSGGAAMNEALLSGNLDIGAAGVTPILTIWDKTRGTVDVKGVASLGSIPLVLVTTNPAVKTIAEFTSKDKIAVPAVNVSIQAVFLQMAAERVFGRGNHAKLNPLTVSMRHPDAFAALLSGTEVTAHISSSPFVEEELASPKARRVLSSLDVIGPTTNVALYTTARFRDGNPAAYRVVLAALREAVDTINRDKNAAARTYIEITKTKQSQEFLAKAFSDPGNVFTVVPQGFMKFADFMHRVGTIKNRPGDWKEVFFPEIHREPGS